jgi:hypothetical protein
LCINDSWNPSIDIGPFLNGSLPVIQVDDFVEEESPACGTGKPEVAVLKLFLRRRIPDEII